ncbi:hypothetical protein FRC11_013455, partial [Ceratobasidium sp. 423]
MSLFNNLIKVFDNFGREKSQTQLVEGAEATQLLKRVDNMLDQSFKMLAAIKDRVPNQEFKEYEFEHNQLYIMVVDVKSDIQEQGNDQVFFASTAERDAFYIRIQKLLERCALHRTEVLLRAKMVVHSFGIKLFLGYLIPFLPGVLSRSQHPTTDPSEDEVDISTLAQSSSEAPGDSQQFIAALAHFPKSALATEEELRAQLPDDDSYYRILICGNKSKRAVVVATVKKDPKLHYASTNDDEDAERSQAEILRVGNMLMKNDPK